MNFIKKISIPAVLIVATPILVGLAYWFVWKRVYHGNQELGGMGQSGDFLAGVAAPIITYMSAIIIYRSFREQVKANKIQFDALQEEIKSRKDDVRKEYYKGLLKTLRDEINVVSYMSPFNGERIFNGMQALEIFSVDYSKNQTLSLNNNENVFDTLFAIVNMCSSFIKKLDIDDIASKQEILEEFVMFYSTKILTVVGNIEDIKGNEQVETINQVNMGIVKTMTKYQVEY
jgi:hypothetical protein